MKPFALAALLALAIAVTGGTSGAQQATKVHRVGALFNRGPNLDDIELLRQGLARRGYVEGTNLVIEARFAEGQLDRLPAFAAELVAMGVDVIAAYGGPPTSAARKATTTIPIVAALVADPVALGFAATLARPGGNVTGITNHDPELAIRQLRILKEVFPNPCACRLPQRRGYSRRGRAAAWRQSSAPTSPPPRRCSITHQMLKLRGPDAGLCSGVRHAMASPRRPRHSWCWKCPSLSAIASASRNWRRHVAFRRCSGAAPRMPVV